VLASVFWDKYEILFVDYLEKGATIMAKYYIAFLNTLKQQLVSKRQGKAFESNLISSRQCCSSQAVHYAPELGRSTL
jgi:hypothetical protein